MKEMLVIPKIIMSEQELDGKLRTPNPWKRQISIEKRTVLGDEILLEPTTWTGRRQGLCATKPRSRRTPSGRGSAEPASAPSARYNSLSRRDDDGGTMSSSSDWRPLSRASEATSTWTAPLRLRTFKKHLQSMRSSSSKNARIWLQNDFIKSWKMWWKFLARRNSVCVLRVWAANLMLGVVAVWLCMRHKPLEFKMV